MPGGLLRQTHSQRPPPQPKDRNLIADNSRQTDRADLADMASASHGVCSTDTLIGASRTIAVMLGPRRAMRPVARPAASAVPGRYRYANAVFRAANSCA